MTATIIIASCCSRASTPCPGGSCDQAACDWFLQEEAELPNLLPERLAEQKVEFSIDLVDPGYRELLDHPDSPQYADLATHLQDQVTTPPPLPLPWPRLLPRPRG